MLNHSPTITVMMRACNKAAKVIARDFLEIEKLQVARKSIHSFVSASDIKAEQTIVAELRRDRPSYGAIVEESGYINPEQEPKEWEVKADATAYRWIIDPIDGTSNFIHGHPNFAISVALEKTTWSKLLANSPFFEQEDDSFNKFSTVKPFNEIVAAVIYLPVTRETYWAEKGGGAYYIDNCGRESRIKVSMRSHLHDSLAATTLSFDTTTQYKKVYNFLYNKHVKFRASGSIAMDLAFFSSGKFDILIYNQLMVWDIAAGALIAKEAGGILNKIPDNRKFNNQNMLGGLIISNETLSRHIIKSINEIQESKIS